MSGPTANYVKEVISKDMVVIFSKSYCPYCQLAKEVFHNMKKNCTIIELDHREDGDKIQSVLREMTGAKTVPRVFINGVCVGGGTDVKELYERGELEKMLVAK
ncbi:uncharacterized protein LOC142329728 isoform X2 [Lycorma delicatula]